VANDNSQNSSRYDFSKLDLPTKKVGIFEKIGRTLQKSNFQNFFSHLHKELFFLADGEES